MFSISRTEDVAVGVEGEEGGEIASNGGEVGDDAVVHEDVAAEDEGMRVYLCDDASAAGPDMGEDTLCLGVVA